MNEEDYIELFERQDIKEAIEKPHVHLSGSMLWLTQHGRCYWCNRLCIQPTKANRRKYAYKTLPPDFFTDDHVHSRWHGGENISANVVGACNRCNQLRNNAEHKRQSGRYVPANQPEEIRLKRFLPAVAHATTIPFEKGLSRRESRKINLRIGSKYATVLELHEKQQVSGFGA